MLREHKFPGIGALRKASETQGWDAPFRGLTAALAPDGAVHHGLAADKVLSVQHESHREGHGLVLMVSHGQKEAQYLASADMLTLSAVALEHASGQVLQLSALLLVNNNAKLTTDTLLGWLGYYRPPMLRMLIQPTINMGYLCGEFSVIIATAAVWESYSWVLYNSGPDSMLTPHGAVALAGWMLWVEPECDAPTSFLGGRYANLERLQASALGFTMDTFVFWPHRFSWQVWRTAARWCLFGWAGDEARTVGVYRANGNATAVVAPPINSQAFPELLLNEVRLQYGLSYRVMPGGGGWFQVDYVHPKRFGIRSTANITVWGKMSRNIPAPKFNQCGETPCWHSLWHCHVPEAIRAWINTTFTGRVPWGNAFSVEDAPAVPTMSGATASPQQCWSVAGC